MSDQALKNAETKRNQLIDRKKALLKEQAEIDDSINRIDRFIRDWHAFAGDSVPVDDGDTSISVDTETESKSTAMHRARPKPKNPKKEDVAEEARNIIHARGEPVMRDELYDLLAERGIHIQGKDPQMVLSTMLWRTADQVVRLKGGGYWLADMPYEPAGYDPEEEENRIERRVQEELESIGDDAEADGLV
jgi:hypothetical protein